MKYVRITVEQIVEVPDDENLTALAMALQESRTLLDNQLDQGNYDVIVHTIGPPPKG